MQGHTIFYDPTSRRWRRVKVLVFVSAIIAVAIASAFLVSLWRIQRLPVLPQLEVTIGRIIPRLPNRQRSIRQALARHTEQQLARQVAREHARPPRSSEIVAAFYAPWQTTGLNSLEANARNLTHLMPAWLRLSTDGARLDYTDWNPAVVPNNLTVIRLAHDNGVAIHAILSNAEEGVFDGARAHALLADSRKQQAIATETVAFLQKNGLQGLNLDFENLDRGDYARLPGFIATLHSALSRARLSLSVDLEPSASGLDWKRVSAVSDLVLVMAYNEHSGQSDPGPISSMPFYERSLRRALREVDSSKLVIGLANYGYDWREPHDGAPLSYQQALFTANETRGESNDAELVDFDPAALNPTYNYVDDGGTTHEVWMLDGVTAANQWSLAQRAHVRGAAVWALGLEDPSIWQFLRRGALQHPIDFRALSRVTYPYAVEYMGEGEILSVVAQPRAGERELDIDANTQLCLDESYASMPTPIVIRRQGYVNKAVALTIDDGPSNDFTPQILDVLKKYNVKATFFLVGQNAERYPDLVRRAFREGHEIGNHTFTHANLAEVSESRARLEMNATQRVIQSLIGRSTTLFRPPYNADAEPRTVEEVRPVVLASQLGYIIVNEFIDPMDWALRIRLADGTIHNRTPEELAATIIDRVHAGHGNDVLLHDAGGDRTLTVKALDLAIPRLQHEGYRFITASQLAGTTRDAVMPPVGRADAYLLGDDRFVFELIYAADVLIALFFLTAIILGIARVIGTSALALRAARRDRRRVFESTYQPKVSVLIAAYNEEKVICRTIHSVLRSGYPDLEIIVVDDGSRDGTGDSVEREFGRMPAIRLIRQENAGKAAALNRAIADAKGEIFVCIDADTLFEPQAVSLLVRHFHDPAIGAVAGNVKVGNRINAATKWQSIEYITSQNLDRKAYSLMNCVTVVPGAIGAWRRDAIVAAGGYASDTMAEDMDLTWRVRMLGWQIQTENDAVARTEAPDNIRSLFRQRFRWAYGTLQCLCKHRSALGRYGMFGGFMLPSLWLFQIVFQLLSPIVDFQVVYALGSVINSVVSSGTAGRGWEIDPNALLSLEKIGAMYVLFLLVEAAGSLLAFSLDKEKKGDLIWLTLQRFVYRQLMYAVVWKSLKTALRGMRTGWGKLDRKATVQLSPEPLEPANAT